MAGRRDSGPEGEVRGIIRAASGDFRRAPSHGSVTFDERAAKGEDNDNGLVRVPSKSGSMGSQPGAGGGPNGSIITGAAPGGNACRGGRHRGAAAARCGVGGSMAQFAAARPQRRALAPTQQILSLCSARR